jgi:hypothetical protein
VDVARPEAVHSVEVSATEQRKAQCRVSKKETIFFQKKKKKKKKQQEKSCGGQVKRAHLQLGLFRSWNRRAQTLVLKVSWSQQIVHLRWFGPFF